MRSAPRAGIRRSKASTERSKEVKHMPVSGGFSPACSLPSRPAIHHLRPHAEPEQGVARSAKHACRPNDGTQRLEV